MKKKRDSAERQSDGSRGRRGELILAALNTTGFLKSVVRCFKATRAVAHAGRINDRQGTPSEPADLFVMFSRRA